MSRLAYPSNNRTPWLWPWAAAVAVFALVGLMQADDAASDEHYAKTMAGIATTQAGIERNERRLNHAAAELCIKTNGLGSKPGWTADNVLVCTSATKRGGA